jgi:soluble lytic murein transglycosylase
MQRQRRSIIALVTLLALLASAAYLRDIQWAVSPTYLTSSSTSESPPHPLSEADKHAYQQIFTHQTAGNWSEADNLIGRLQSPALLGHVLAERYLHDDYASQPAELLDWLALYTDHPQYKDLRNLAERKNVKPGDIPPQKLSRLRGYGDDNGLASSFGDSPHSLTWYKAMKEWREGSKLDAAKLFASMLKDEELSPWKRTAAAYWSHRAYHATGRAQEATKMLNLAASEPRSFYGILARQKLGLSLELDVKPIELTETDLQEVMTIAHARRASALVQVGRNDLAERELRLAFPNARHEQKILLLGLAHRLSLPSVQIAMARQLGGDERSFDFARYPIPSWQPKDGFSIEPALLYALIRQESGFHASAQSPSGALGLMQLMPKTASYMQQKRNDSLNDVMSAKDPHFNMSLGQDYVNHLLENELVEGNLIFMLTAYNAGPGRLQEWKKTIEYKDDPLLFIESIPFPETKNYVMQVMTNYWIYAELTGKPTKSAGAILIGNWPSMGPVS